MKLTFRKVFIGLAALIGVTAAYFPEFYWSQQAALVLPTDPQFGAACDGVTDDSVALQKWLNVLGTSAVSSSPVYTGYIPGGTCTFKSHLNGPLKNSISIGGTGINSQLRYTGTDPTVTPIQWGQTNSSCSSQSLTLHDFIISSATLMTAGSAMEFDDVCALRMTNVVVANNSGGSYGNWANGIIVKGGNQIYLTNNAISGNINGVLLYGDPTVQLTDPRITGGIIVSSSTGVGVHVAGNVGGLVLDDTDLINSQTQLRIDQSGVAVPNSQIFLGPTLFIDATTGVGGRGISLDDAGSNNSILSLSGTWLASSSGSCFIIATGAQWVINWTGGWLVNCGADGVTNFSTNITGSIKDITVAMQSGGYGGGTGYNFNCLVPNLNFRFYNITTVSSNPLGQYSSNCNTTNTVVTVANGGSAVLPNSVGSQFVVKNNANGDSATYMCAASGCTLLGASASTSWVTATNAPAAGKLSVQQVGTVVSAYNNTGASVTVSANMNLF